MLIYLGLQQFKKKIMIKMKQTDEGVEVWGAKGRQPTPTYKISATYLDGYKVEIRVDTNHLLLNF